MVSIQEKVGIHNPNFFNSFPDFFHHHFYSSKAGEPGQEVKITMDLNGAIKDMEIDEALKGDLDSIKKVDSLLALKRILVFFLTFLLFVQLTKEATRKASLRAAKMKPILKSTPYDPCSRMDLISKFSRETKEQYEKFYENDELFTSHLLDPPPIRKLFSVYGINMDTEVLQFYRRLIK